MTLVKNLWHILFTGPLLIYIGLTKPQNPQIYNFLFILGIILSIYFLYLISTLKYSPYHTWLLIHYLIFIPLLIYTGLKKTKTPNIIYSLLLAIGIAAFGYHSIRLFQEIKKNKS